MSDTTVISADKISKGIQLDLFESSVKIDNILTSKFHQFNNILTTYRDNNLFLRETLGNHINMGLRLAYFINYPINIFYLFLKRPKRSFP